MGCPFSVQMFYKLTLDRLAAENNRRTDIIKFPPLTTVVCPMSQQDGRTRDDAVFLFASNDELAMMRSSLDVCC